MSMAIGQTHHCHRTLGQPANRYRGDAIYDIGSNPDFSHWTTYYRGRCHRVSDLGSVKLENYGFAWHKQLPAPFFPNFVNSFGKGTGGPVYRLLTYSQHILRDYRFSSFSVEPRPLCSSSWVRQLRPSSNHELSGLPSNIKSVSLIATAGTQE